MAINLINSHNLALYTSHRGRTSFYAEGRYWMFFRERQAGETTARLLKHKSREDEGSWGDEATVWDSGANGRLMFGIWFDGTYVLLTYSRNNNSCPIYFRRGTPNSDGTITWDAVRTVASATTFYASIAICRENGPDEHIWVHAAKIASPYTHRCYESSTSDGSGAWTYRLAEAPAGTSFCWVAQCVPLESAGQVYFPWNVRVGAGSIYDRVRGSLWNGTAFVNDGVIAVQESRVSMCVSRGDEVYLSYEKTTPYSVLYGIKRSSLGVWSVQETIATGLNRGSHTDIVWDDDSNTLYAYYSKSADNDIYRSEADGSLATPTWGTETQKFIRGANTMHQVKTFGWCQGTYGCKFMVAWMEYTAPNYYLYESPDDADWCPCDIPSGISWGRKPRIFEYQNFLNRLEEKKRKKKQKALLEAILIVEVMK